MTADPHIVSNSKRLRNISAGELVNLCDSGVKFIRRKALRYLDGSFQVRIRGNHNSNLASQGTVVTGCLPEKPSYLGYPSPICMLTIVGKASEDRPKTLLNVFERICNAKLPILVQSIDTDTASIFFPEVWAERTVETVHTIIIQNRPGLAMALRKQLAFLKIAGVESENTTKTLKKVTESFEQRKVRIAWICTVASSTLLFVDWIEKDTALHAVKEALKAC